MAPTGIGPGYAADEIYASLREYARKTGRGHAVADNRGFRVKLPHRESFSPDAAYVDAPPKRTLKFYEGAPIFAVEVRSEGDYGPAAERQMAQKRADYFAAGTLVVWGVDLLSEEIVRVYHAADPEHPTSYRRGDIAEAEPAVPGWTVAVNELLP
jgi:Uma2 family endonuclease